MLAISRPYHVPPQILTAWGVVNATVDHDVRLDYDILSLHHEESGGIWSTTLSTELRDISYQNVINAAIEQGLDELKRHVGNYVPCNLKTLKEKKIWRLSYMDKEKPVSLRSA